LNNSLDEYTIFITFEYLNKIFLTEKGFENFPLKKSSEKTSYSIYKQENNNDIKEEQEDIIPYKELIYIAFEFLKTKAIFLKKTFLINSVCNFIANVFRIIWLDLKNPVILINRVISDFMNDVKFFINFFNS